MGLPTCGAKEHQVNLVEGGRGLTGHARGSLEVTEAEKKNWDVNKTKCRKKNTMAIQACLVVDSIRTG